MNEEHAKQTPLAASSEYAYLDNIEMGHVRKETHSIKAQQSRVKLVVGKSNNFRDVRCEECGRLLYRELLKSGPVNRVIEIKCRKCGHLNVS
jgi:ribosomal protein S27E